MITRADDKVMNKAVFLLKKMSADDKLREIARIRERALHDEASYIADAKAEGAADILEILKSLGTDEELLKRAQTEYANKG